MDFSPSIKVLFVCNGNTCRSPMAEAIAKYMVSERQKQNSAMPGYVDGSWIFKSAGLAPSVGEVMNSNAVEALHEAGVPESAGNEYSMHTATALSEELLVWADEVYCMTSSHYSQLVYTYPRFVAKYHLMPVAVPDPYGLGTGAYQETIKAIIESVATILENETKL